MQKMRECIEQLSVNLIHILVNGPFGAIVGIKTKSRDMKTTKTCNSLFWKKSFVRIKAKVRVKSKV